MEVLPFDLQRPKALASRQRGAPTPGPARGPPPKNTNEVAASTARGRSQRGARRARAECRARDPAHGSHPDTVFAATHGFERAPRGWVCCKRARCAGRRIAGSSRCLSASLATGAGGRLATWVLLLDDPEPVVNQRTERTAPNTCAQARAVAALSAEIRFFPPYPSYECGDPVPSGEGRRGVRRGVRAGGAGRRG
jgi:hypothetical protein